MGNLREIERLKILIKILFLLLFINNLQAGFIKNEGQWEDNVIYYGEFIGYNLWLTDESLVFDNYQYEATENGKIKNGFVYKLNFFDANKFNYQEFNKLNHNFNFIRNKSIQTNEYEKIIIKNIYDDVDLILKEQDGYLRYDFAAANGRAAQQIKMLLDCNFEINNSKIEIKNPFGEIEHKDLFAFNTETKQPINISFSDESNYITFSVDEAIEHSITIDPYVFSTYFGGTKYDFSRDMVLDGAGNIYITGFTSSLNFPTTSGVYSRELMSSQWDYPDVFVSKFTPNADSLIFSTYIGGLGDDYGEGIALDDSNNIYVTGYTWPVEFPTTENAFQDTAQSGYDAFLFKLDSTGSNLVYSTLIGGTKDDYGIAIITNNSGEAFITGYFTAFGNYPITDNAFLKTSRGKYDTFITKVNADGSDLIFSTYLSGTNDDFGQDILLYPDNKVLVCGRTSSSDFLTTPNAVSRDYAANDTSNAYISIISQDGSTLEYSSFFGGSKEDGAYSIAFDNDYNIYLTGYTESTDLPTTNNAYDRILNYDFNLTGNSDAFLVKFTNSGTQIEYSTYFGGTNAERAYSVAVDDNYFAYLAGTTNSPDMEIRGRAVDTTIAGLEKTSDALIAKFTPDGSELAYSTYLGGSFNEVARAVAVNNEDFTIVATGMTNSQDFYTYGLNSDSTYNDTLKADIFISRIMPSFIHFSLGADAQICEGDTVFINVEPKGGFGEYSYSWEPNYAVSDSASSSIFLFPDTTTIYKLTIRDTADHEEYDFIKVNVLPSPIFSLSGPSSSPDSANALYIVDDFSVIDSVHWQVENGRIINSDILSCEVQWLTGPAGKLYLTAFNENSCSHSDSILVVIGEKFDFKINLIKFSDVLCEGDFAVIEPDSNYAEYFYSDGTITRLDTITKTGMYYLIVKNDAGFYGISDTLDVTFIPKPKLFINGANLCTIDSLYTYQIANESGVIYDYQINGGEIISNQNGVISIIWRDSPNGNLSINAENAAGCTDSISKSVLIGNFGKPQLIGLDSDGNILEGDFNFCSGDTITLDAGAGYKSYQWSDSTSSRYLKIWEEGIYWVNTVDFNDEAHFSDTIQIRTLIKPPKPQVSILDTKLRCNTIAKSYQWYLNGNILAGITERIIEPTQNGQYQVEITANNGCKNISDITNFNNTSVIEIRQREFEIYPNPASKFLFIKNADAQNFEIYNIFGKIIMNDIYSEKINIESLPAGVYYIKLGSNVKVFVKI